LPAERRDDVLAGLADFGAAATAHRAAAAAAV
jgi:hypothetical protein